MEYIKKLLSGLALGLGFTLAAVIVVYITSGIVLEKMTSEAYSEAEEQIADGSFGYKRYTSDSGLMIKSHTDRKINNGMEVLVEIENTGEDTWSSVSVEVELFDENNKFVDECSGYLRGKIKPGEVKNTKIKCGGCSNNKLVEYSTYKASIADASSF